MSERSRRYRAFISYSQKDKAHARRLHRALETYRLPKGVEISGAGATTRKLGRFFRDDEEMGAATDLGAALEGAISEAENLIVLCSPNAAKSKWVNQEVIHFKGTGRANNVFAVVVDGMPNTGDARECFPPALCFELGANGTLTDRRAEPLAVNLRNEGFSRVLVRLVAGLLAIPFDTLWRRDRRRARAQMATMSLAVSVIALLLASAVTQNLWRPRLDAYLQYERHTHSSEELLAAAPGTTFQDCVPGSTLCPAMVVIPAGQFIMGSSPDDPENVFMYKEPPLPGTINLATPDEQRLAEQMDRDWQLVAEQLHPGSGGHPESPQRAISVKSLAVSEYEITIADWRTCVEAGGCDNFYPNLSEVAAGYGETLPPNVAIRGVSWEDAQRYVTWLSQLTHARYRLLSEAEWEYAARGQTEANAPHTRFAWGDAEPSCYGHPGAAPPEPAAGDIRAAPLPCSIPELAAVPANAFGLHGMNGNVAEWVDDCFADYDASRSTPDAVPPVGTKGSRCDRVVRGGSSWGRPHDMRSSSRTSEPQDSRNITIGFRVARSL